MEHVTEDIFEWTGRRELTEADRRYAKKMQELRQTQIDEERKGIFRVTPGYEEKQKRTHKGTLRPGKPGQRTRVERSTDRLPHRTRNTEYLSVDW